jgi:hypothetical protein
MRRRRTIYFNDARHHYLFVHEPPMRLEDAWGPIDEVAGTTVDTFSYGVSRGDGLFYPSKVGLRFGANKDSFDMAAYWRVWENMQSLIDRGLDPLQVLIDRAHDKGMDFIASLRMGEHPGLEGDYSVGGGGRGYVHAEPRQHKLAVFEELATQYAIEGVELDFAAAPGGSSFCFTPEDAVEYAPVMTELVGQIATLVRQRPGQPGLIGARVYPTEELNLKAGLDVTTWLREGLVDFVVPVLYLSFILDSDMPIDWLVEAAHEHDISVYPMLQPFSTDETRSRSPRLNATPEMMRAAAASFYEKGADGLYTWMMNWPLGDSERRILAEVGDPERVKEGNKHYFLRRRCEAAEDFDYPAHLPLEIAAADPDKIYQIPFFVGDDMENRRIARVQLHIGVTNLVSSHRLEVRLNGQTLAAEVCRRKFSWLGDPYLGQWLEFELDAVWPRQGRNLLEVVLQEHPARFDGKIAIEDVEVIVDYGPYPAARSGR